jgi:tRNA A37 methylthiotransferase MiaB
MTQQVPVHVGRERNRVLRDLADQKKLAFMKNFVGNKVEALTLAYGADTPVRDPNIRPFTETLTDNYLPLRIRGEIKPNQWLQAHVETLEGGKLVGISTTAV